MKRLTHDQMVKKVRQFIAGYETQREAARAIGCTPSDVSQIMTRRSQQPMKKMILAAGYRAVTLYEAVS